MIPRLIVYLLLGVVALGVTVATLGLPSTAEPRAEGAHLGFGYPVSFVWADETGWADWLPSTLLLWASLWFLRRAFTARRPSLSPS